METGFEPVYTDLQSVASPLGQPTAGGNASGGDLLRADDEARTRDLNLGKVALYQLSYVRLLLQARFPVPLATRRTLSEPLPEAKSGVTCVSFTCHLDDHTGALSLL